MEQIGRISLNVLIIARYDPSIDWMQISLQEQSYRLAGRVESIDQALQQIDEAQIDVILADTSAEGVLETGWIQMLAKQTSKILILVITTSSEMDFIREAMLAGAHGFLIKPFDLPELSRSIEQVHQLWLQRHALLAEEMPETGATAKPTRQAHAIAVYSPKGGTGATTLAVNLAVSLKQQTEAKVLLVDLDLRTADVDIFLSIFSKNSILDLVGLEQKIDKDLLERVATEHVTGIKVIRGDSQLQFVESPFEPGQIGELIEELLLIWDGYIVINTSNGLDRWTIEILDIVDRVIVVTTPELPSLRATRNFLDLAEAAVNESSKWKVVMNTYQGSKVLRTSDIEASIHFPIAATISEDYTLVPTSINRGTPLIASSRKSSIARDISALATQLIETTPNSSAPTSTRSNSSKPEANDQITQPRRFGIMNSLTSVMRLTQNSVR